MSEAKPVAEVGEGSAAPALWEKQRLSRDVNPSWLCEVDTYVDEELRARVTRIVGHMLERLVVPHVPAVADRLDADPGRLEHHFRSRCGMHLSPFILSLQTRTAARLLTDPHVTLTEAAYRSGFLSAGPFFAHFERAFGVTPRSYRRTAFRALTSGRGCRPYCPAWQEESPHHRKDLRVLLARLGSSSHAETCADLACPAQPWRQVMGTHLIGLLRLVSIEREWSRLWVRVFFRILGTSSLLAVSELPGGDLSERSFLRMWKASITITPGVFLQMLRLRFVESAQARGATRVEACGRFGFSSVTYYYATRRRLGRLDHELLSGSGKRPVHVRKGRNESLRDA